MRLLIHILMAAIFLLLELPVICHGLLNYVFYKKNRTPLIQMCKYTGYVVTFELFLLAASRHLELLEGVLGILAGVLANMAAMGAGRREDREKRRTFLKKRTTRIRNFILYEKDS